jgi:hypothetical protein
MASHSNGLPLEAVQTAAKNSSMLDRCSCQEQQCSRLCDILFIKGSPLFLHNVVFHVMPCPCMPCLSVCCSLAFSQCLWHVPWHGRMNKRARLSSLASTSGPFGASPIQLDITHRERRCKFKSQMRAATCLLRDAAKDPNAVLESTVKAAYASRDGWAKVRH